jgi:dihydrophenazinedicarboxylate synthase
MVLATIDERGRPATRVVLLKGCDPRGILFTTHRTSVRGRQLDLAPFAAASLVLAETLQQISVSGPVEPISKAEATELFRQRPRDAQATTAASRQSAPLGSEGRLADAADVILQQSEIASRRLGRAGIVFVP